MMRTVRFWVAFMALTIVSFIMACIAKANTTTVDPYTMVETKSFDPWRGTGDTFSLFGGIGPFGLGLIALAALAAVFVIPWQLAMKNKNGGAGIAGGIGAIVFLVAGYLQFSFDIWGGIKFAFGAVLLAGATFVIGVIFKFHKTSQPAAPHPTYYMD